MEDVTNYALSHDVRHVGDVVASLVVDKLKVGRRKFIVLFVDGCRIYQRYRVCQMTDVINYSACMAGGVCLL